MAAAPQPQQLTARNQAGGSARRVGGLNVLRGSREHQVGGVLYSKQHLAPPPSVTSMARLRNRCNAASSLAPPTAQTTAADSAGLTSRLSPTMSSSKGCRPQVCRPGARVGRYQHQTTPCSASEELCLASPASVKTVQHAGRFTRQHPPFTPSCTPAPRQTHLREVQQAARVGLHKRRVVTCQQHVEAGPPLLADGGEKRIH